MFGYVYITTNLVNGKQYIGRCKSEIFLGTKYLGSGLALKEAIQKYGTENFKVEILDTAESDNELNEKEEYYIDYYDAVKSSQYYNLRRGGSRGPGGPMFKSHKHSLETRKKMSEQRQGCLNGTYGHHWTLSDESKALHSRLSSGKNNGMYGKKHTEESKALNRLHNINTKWINNGTINRHIKEQELPQFLSEGWKLGMLPKNKHK